ncbi:MAG: 4'-phosphopantetheinyl transferase superfamily protein [Terracidiphilus sp.]|nr:4'-phosphopantetheinyl transferase superfamily protein [Terracidiphilus sp.]
METRKLQLWFAYPGDLLSKEAEEASANLLSECERAHWQRFCSESNRRASLTGRVLVRVALSHVHPIPPREWKFSANRQGKPIATPKCGVRFNLSSTEEMAACAVAGGAEVGVDVEPHMRGPQIVHMAEKYFSPAEMAQLMGLDGDEKLNRILSLWALKEAYIKARGVGTPLPLKLISFLFGGPAGVRMVVDPSIGEKPLHWQFALLDFAGHRIALMVEQKYTWHLEILEARSLLEPPAAIHAGVLGWFPWA